MLKSINSDVICLQEFPNNKNIKNCNFYNLLKQQLSYLYPYIYLTLDQSIISKPCYNVYLFKDKPYYKYELKFDEYINRKRHSLFFNIYGFNFIATHLEIGPPYHKYTKNSDIYLRSKNIATQLRLKQLTSFYNFCYNHNYNHNYNLDLLFGDLNFDIYNDLVESNFINSHFNLTPVKTQPFSNTTPFNHTDQFHFNSKKFKLIHDHIIKVNYSDHLPHYIEIKIL